MSIPRLLLLLLVVVVAAHTADASPYYVCPSAAQSIVAGSTSSSSSLCCPIGWIYKGGVCRTGVCANSADRYCAEATSLSCCPADTAYFEYMYCSSDGSCTGFDPQMSFILYHSSTAFTVTGSVAPSSVVDVSAHCVTTAPCLYGTACTPTIDSYTCACPLGFAPPNCTFQCPNGYECFSAPSGNSTAFNSSRVPAGSYLTLSSMIPTPTPLPCPVAYVCPVGSSQPVLCDGMYCPDTGMSTGLPCPAGFLCTAAYNGSTVPYVPAYACANLSLVLSANDPTACCPPDKSSSTHQQCYSGSSSCPSAGIMCTSPISCCNSGTSCSGGGQCLQVITPYNFYTPTTAFPTSVVSTVPSIEVHEHCIGWDPIANGCLHGTGCRATVLGAQCACPTNFVAPNCTFLAPPGAVIVTLPAVNSTIYESMPCLAGYSCTGGNNTLPTPMVECQAGQYCPSGSSNWIACPPGFFCPNAGLSAPVSCPSQATCPGFGNIASTYPVFACAITGDAPASNMNLYPATGLPVPLCCGGGGMWYANYGCLNTNTARCSVNGYVKCNGISLCCYQGWTCVLSSVYPQGAACFWESGGFTDPTKQGLVSYIPTGYTPAYPAVDISSHCHPTPCQHGFACTPTFASFTCACSGLAAVAFQGATCDFVAPGGVMIAVAPATNTSQYSSVPCTAGFMCPVNGTVPTVPVACFPGGYCPSSSTTSIPCSSGSYCPSSSAAPVPCASGSYCPASSPSPRSCPLGAWCGSRSAVPTLCGVGTFSATINATDASTCIPCPPGTSCPTTGLNTTTSCPPGSTCADVTRPPQPCGSGFFCPFTNMTWPFAALPGFFAPAGSIQPTPCTNSHYCPTGELAAPLPCPPGMLCIGLGTIVPVTPYWLCGSGSVMVDVLPLAFPPLCCSMPSAGSYSIAIINGVCVLGGGGGMFSYFSTSLAIDVSSRCRPVPCAHGTTCTPTLTDYTCACPTGDANFVPPNCTFVSVGGEDVVYPPAVDSVVYLSQPCAGGFTCPPNGALPTIPIPCPGGTFCPVSSATPSPCPAGSFCVAQSTKPTACLAGSYCVSNSSTATPCPAGSTCASGVASPTIVSAGSWSSSGASVSQPCPAGSFCEANCSSPVPCAAGFYCPFGSSRLIACTTPGTYCPSGAPAPITCPRNSACGYNASDPQAFRAPVPCPTGTTSAPGSSECVSGSSSNNNNNNGIPLGAIIGGVVCGVCAMAVTAAALVWYRRHRRNSMRIAITTKVLAGPEILL